MTTITEKPKQKGHYIILRKDDAIKQDLAPIEAKRDSLNTLVALMAQTEFPLTTIDDINEAINKGTVLYTKERIVKNADQKAIKSLYGFVPEQQELIRMAPVPDEVKKAEGITASLRSGLALADYDFNAGRFEIKEEVKQWIMDRHTRYATSKKEEELFKRMEAFADQWNKLYTDLIEYAPNIHQNSWCMPEALLVKEPFKDEFRLDKRSLITIFNLRR